MRRSARHFPRRSDRRDGRQPVGNKLPHLLVVHIGGLTLSCPEYELPCRGAPPRGRGPGGNFIRSTPRKCPGGNRGFRLIRMLSSKSALTASPPSTFGKRRLSPLP